MGELEDLLAHENETAVEERKDETQETSQSESTEITAKEETGQTTEGDSEGAKSEDEVRLTRKEYEELQSKLTELSSKIQPEQKKEPEEPKEPEDKDIDFLGSDRLDDILSEPAKVNLLLNKLRRATRDESLTKAQERILRSIPEVVRTSVSRFTALREMVSDFYKENQDLKPHKQFVGLVANEIATTNPDKSNQPDGIKWIFNEAAKESRRRLKLTQKKEESRQSEPGKKTLPGGTGSSSRGGPAVVEKKSKVAKEIDEMLSSL